MKRIILGAVAALALSVGAAHAEDLFAVAYGNSVTSTGPDGKTVTIYVNADKTWEQHLGDGKVIKGTYNWKDASTACFTVTDPVPKDASKATNCDHIEGGHKVGDTWTQKDDNGNVYTMAIKAGRS
ncbi:MAG TPA: hypothetical protein VFI93_00330 [Rhizomicrobium sp.]|nr:hypothetical protein [Rhizomicrobium sp.]